MPIAINLTASQAAAVRSALTALGAEKGQLHIDFAPVEVFVTDLGWITVRGGRGGIEEYKTLREFASAYELADPQPDLMALAQEMEAMCDAFLIHAVEEGNETASAIWAKRRDRCRAAAAAALAE